MSAEAIVTSRASCLRTGIQPEKGGWYVTIMRHEI